MQYKSGAAQLHPIGFENPFISKVRLDDQNPYQKIQICKPSNFACNVAMILYTDLFALMGSANLMFLRAHSRIQIQLARLIAGWLGMLVPPAQIIRWDIRNNSFSKPMGAIQNVLDFNSRSNANMFDLQVCVF